MARTPAVLPEGTRLTDFVSIGVLTTRIPLGEVRRVLAAEGRESKRQRKLPAHVVVYYVIGMVLYMGVSYGEVLRCLCEGLDWLGLPGVKQLRNTGKSAISQARSRLGVAPMMRLYREIVAPIATRKTRGAYYRDWLLVSIDGSTLDVADTDENRETFGKPSGRRGEGAFPKIRFVCLAENGTRVLFSARVGSYRTGENTLASELLAELNPDMLCLADRGFYSFEAWQAAAATGAAQVWRVKKDLIFSCVKALDDGSYLAKAYANSADRARDRDGVLLRVIEYTLEGTDKADEVYRLVTTILDPEEAPAVELASLYHERWEIETAFDEFKTHLRGARVVLRSKTPGLVMQEFYGLLLAHYAVRGLMHEAALGADIDPDDISFTHALRVVRRKVPAWASIPPSGEKQPS